MTIREQIVAVLKYVLNEIETEKDDWVDEFIKTLEHDDIINEVSRRMTIKENDVEQFTVTLTLSKGNCDEESDYEYEDDDDIWFADEL